MALLSVTTTHLFLVTLALIHVALPMTACMAQHAPTPVLRNLNTKKIVFPVYLLEILQGPNATSVPVAGVQGKFWNDSSFGTIRVADHILLEKPDIYSTQIGRLKGLAVAASKDEQYLFQTSSFMFFDEYYNYSTLQTQGIIRNSGKPSEVAVTGGTGKFRGAKGYDILTVLFQNAYYRLSKIIFYFTMPKYGTET